MAAHFRVLPPKGRKKRGRKADEEVFLTVCAEAGLSPWTQLRPPQMPQFLGERLAAEHLAKNRPTSYGSVHQLCQRMQKTVKEPKAETVEARARLQLSAPKQAAKVTFAAECIGRVAVHTVPTKEVAVELQRQLAKLGPEAGAGLTMTGTSIERVKIEVKQSHSCKAELTERLERAEQSGRMRATVFEDFVEEKVGISTPPPRKAKAELGKHFQSEELGQMAAVVIESGTLETVGINTVPARDVQTELGERLSKMEAEGKSTLTIEGRSIERLQMGTRQPKKAAAELVQHLCRCGYAESAGLTAKEKCSDRLAKTILPAGKAQTEGNLHLRRRQKVEAAQLTMATESSEKIQLRAKPTKSVGVELSKRVEKVHPVGEARLTFPEKAIERLHMRTKSTRNRNRGSRAEVVAQLNGVESSEEVALVMAEHSKGEQFHAAPVKEVQRELHQRANTEEWANLNVASTSHEIALTGHLSKTESETGLTTNAARAAEQVELSVRPTEDIGAELHLEKMNAAELVELAVPDKHSQRLGRSTAPSKKTKTGLNEQLVMAQAADSVQLVTPSKCIERLVIRIRPTKSVRIELLRHLQKDSEEANTSLNVVGKMIDTVMLRVSPPKKVRTELAKQLESFKPSEGTAIILADTSSEHLQICTTEMKKARADLIQQLQSGAAEGTAEMVVMHRQVVDKLQIRTKPTREMRTQLLEQLQKVHEHSEAGLTTIRGEVFEQLELCLREARRARAEMAGLLRRAESTGEVGANILSESVQQSELHTAPMGKARADLAQHLERGECTEVANMMVRVDCVERVQKQTTASAVAQSELATHIHRVGAPQPAEASLAIPSRCLLERVRIGTASPRKRGTVSEEQLCRAEASDGTSTTIFGSATEKLELRISQMAKWRADLRQHFQNTGTDQAASRPIVRSDFGRVSLQTASAGNSNAELSQEMQGMEAENGAGLTVFRETAERIDMAASSAEMTTREVNATMQSVRGDGATADMVVPSIASERLEFRTFPKSRADLAEHLQRPYSAAECRVSLPDDLARTEKSNIAPYGRTSAADLLQHLPMAASSAETRLVVSARQVEKSQIHLLASKQVHAVEGNLRKRDSSEGTGILIAEVQSGKMQLNSGQMGRERADVSEVLSRGDAEAGAKCSISGGQREKLHFGTREMATAAHNCCGEEGKKRSREIELSIAIKQAVQTKSEVKMVKREGGAKAEVEARAKESRQKRASRKSVVEKTEEAVAMEKRERSTIIRASAEAGSEMLKAGEDGAGGTGTDTDMEEAKKQKDLFEADFMGSRGKAKSGDRGKGAEKRESESDEWSQVGETRRRAEAEAEVNAKRELLEVQNVASGVKEKPKPKGDDAKSGIKVGVGSKGEPKEVKAKVVMMKIEEIEPAEVASKRQTEKAGAKNAQNMAGSDESTKERQMQANDWDAGEMVKLARKRVFAESGEQPEKDGAGRGERRATAYSMEQLQKDYLAISAEEEATPTEGSRPAECHSAEVARKRALAYSMELLQQDYQRIRAEDEQRPGADGSPKRNRKKAVVVADETESGDGEDGAGGGGENSKNEREKSRKGEERGKERGPEREEKGPKTRKKRPGDGSGNGRREHKAAEKEKGEHPRDEAQLEASEGEEKLRKEAAEPTENTQLRTSLSAKKRSKRGRDVFIASKEAREEVEKMLESIVGSFEEANFAGDLPEENASICTEWAGKDAMESIEVLLSERPIEYGKATALAPKVNLPRRRSTKLFDFEPENIEHVLLRPHKSGAEPPEGRRSVKFRLPDPGQIFHYEPIESPEAQETEEDLQRTLRSPRFVIRQRKILAKVGERIVLKLQLRSALEPRMSIYHNNQHLAEDNERIRFLVDRQEDLWTVLLVFTRIDHSLAGDFTFVASNELGIDEAGVRIRVEDEVQTDGRKAPHLKETVPAVVEVEEADTGDRMLNFVVEGEPLPHVEMWLEKKGQMVPCKQVKLNRMGAQQIEVALKLKKLLIEDGDQIVLQAVNTHGEMQSKHVLHVRQNDESKQRGKLSLDKGIELSTAKKAQDENETVAASVDEGEAKRRKHVPIALFIPKEINSLYGDPSVHVSMAYLMARASRADPEANAEYDIAVSAQARIAVESTEKTVEVGKGGERRVAKGGHSGQVTENQPTGAEKGDAAKEVDEGKECTGQMPTGRRGGRQESVRRKDENGGKTAQRQRGCGEGEEIGRPKELEEGGSIPGGSAEHRGEKPMESGNAKMRRRNVDSEEGHQMDSGSRQKRPDQLLGAENAETTSEEGREYAPASGATSAFEEGGVEITPKSEAESAKWKYLETLRSMDWEVAEQKRLEGRERGGQDHAALPGGRPAEDDSRLALVADNNQTRNTMEQEGKGAKWMGKIGLSREEDGLDAKGGKLGAEKAVVLKRGGEDGLRAEEDEAKRRIGFEMRNKIGRPTMEEEVLRRIGEFQRGDSAKEKPFGSEHEGRGSAEEGQNLEQMGELCRGDHTIRMEPQEGVGTERRDPGLEQSAAMGEKEWKLRCIPLSKSSTSGEGTKEGAEVKQQNRPPAKRLIRQRQLGSGGSEHSSVETAATIDGQKRAEAQGIRGSSMDVARRVRGSDGIGTGSELGGTTDRGEEKGAQDTRGEEFKLASSAEKWGQPQWPRTIRPRSEGLDFVCVPDPQMSALSGDTVLFECELFNESDQVSWQIDDKPLEKIADSRVTTRSSGHVRQLRIRDISPEDHGKRVKLVLGSQTFESRLSVEEAPIEILGKLPRKVVSRCSDSTSFSAVLSRNATEKISWFHDGREVVGEGENCTTLTEERVCTLEIREVDYRHAGRYSLRVGGVETSTLLEVRGKPRMDAEDKAKAARIALDAGEDLHVQLRFEGVPEPEVELRLNGDWLAPEVRTSMALLEDKLVLTRKGMARADGGSYRVELSNECGRDILECEVYVRDVLEAPPGLMVTDVGHNHCFLKWNPPPVPPTLEECECLTGYLVEKKAVQRRVWQRVGQFSPFTLEAYVEELDSEAEYEFRVAALNRFGAGPFSAIAKIATGTPFTAPRMASAPRVMRTSRRSVRLEWDHCWDTGGSPLFGYDVFWRTPGGSWQKVNEDTVFADSAWLEDFLDEGKRGCVFRIEAQNYAGLHSDSNLCSEPLDWAQHCEGIIPAPEVHMAGPNRLDVQWTVPIEWKAPEKAHFIVQYCCEGGCSWNSVPGEFRGSSAVLDGELREGVPYRLRVLARTPGGEQLAQSEESHTVVVPESETMRGMQEPRQPEKRERDGADEWVIDRADTTDPETKVQGYRHRQPTKGTSAESGVSLESEGTRRLPTAKSECARILVSPLGRTVRAFGERISLAAELASPPERITWFQNGERLFQSGRRYAFLEGKRAVLDILNFGASDVGEYQLEVDGAERSIPALLALEVAPEVQLRRFGVGERLVRKAGEGFSLHASVVGHPCPEFSLSLNGRRFPDALIVEGRQEGELHIHVRRLTAAHSGAVRLHARNAHGEHEVHVNLLVRSVPAAPTRLSAENISGTSVDLVWEWPGEGPDSAPSGALEGFVVERKAQERCVALPEIRSRWRRIHRMRTNRTLGGQTFEHRVEGLLPNELYTFRVRATNDVGASGPSNEVEVLTPEEQVCIAVVAVRRREIRAMGVERRFQSNDADSSNLSVEAVEPGRTEGGKEEKFGHPADEREKGAMQRMRAGKVRIK